MHTLHLLTLSDVNFSFDPNDLNPACQSGPPVHAKELLPPGGVARRHSNRDAQHDRITQSTSQLPDFSTQKTRKRGWIISSASGSLCCFPESCGDFCLFIL